MEKKVEAKPAAAAAKKPAIAKGKADKKDKVTPFRKEHAHLFASAAKDFRIGRDIHPGRDLSRFVKWPRYIRLQRQRSILKKRLKVPAAVNHFAKTLDANQGTVMLATCGCYASSLT